MAGRASPSTASLATMLSKADASSLKKMIADAVQDGIRQFLTPLQTQVTTIDKSVKELNKDISELKDKTATVGNVSEKSKHEISGLSQQLRTHEQLLSALTWESAQKKLRIQDLSLPEGVDLKQTVTQLLAPIAGIPEEELAYQIQAIYRIETQYIKRNNLAREIHIRFKQREARDAILYGANKNPVEYAGKKIRILKDIPLIVRKNRTDFKPLAKQLIDKGITFKWLIPKGLQFKFRDQIFRLVSTQDITDFLEKYGEDFKAGRAEGAVPKTKPKEKAKQGKEIERKQQQKMELRPKKT